LSEVLGITEKVSAQMIALEKACFSEVDVLRVQLVVMFLKAIFAAAQVMEYMCAAEKFTIDDKFVAKLVAFGSATRSFLLLVAESQPRADIINAGWCFRFEDWRESSESLGIVLPSLHSTWHKRLSELTKKIHKINPEQALLDNKVLMSSPVLAKTLSTCVEKLVKSDLLKRCSEELLHIKKYIDTCVECPTNLRQAHNDLLAVRRVGKTAVIVNWSLQEVNKFKPESGPCMVDFAKNLIAKCLSKGVSKSDGTMPVWLSSVLDGLVARGEKLAREAADKLEPTGGLTPLEA
jgi:hypothetical protein